MSSEAQRAKFFKPPRGKRISSRKMEVVEAGGGEEYKMRKRRREGEKRKKKLLQW